MLRNSTVNASSLPSKFWVTLADSTLTSPLKGALNGAVPNLATVKKLLAAKKLQLTTVIHAR
jgi:hypothetical protein